MTDLMLLKFESVSQRVSLSRKSIYSLIKRGDFPRQVKIGRASRWLRHEIDDWIESKALNRD